MRDNGYEGIALEFQQNANIIAERQARALEEIARTLANLGVVATRVAESLAQIPVQEGRSDPPEAWPVYDH